MKHLKIEITHELPDDFFAQAEIGASARKVMEGIRASLNEHLPTANLVHTVVPPEPETPEKAPRKPRKALGAGLAPEAVLIRGNDAPEPQPESAAEAPAPRGRHRAAA